MINNSFERHHFYKYKMVNMILGPIFLREILAVIG